MSRNNQDSQSMSTFFPSSYNNGRIPTSKTRMNGYTNPSMKNNHISDSLRGNGSYAESSSSHLASLPRNDYVRNSQFEVTDGLNGKNSENGYRPRFTQSAHQPETIAVIGTGDLGRALVTCLVRRGYRVVVGSRNPERNRHKVENVGGKIDSYANALKQGKIVILAIPVEGFTTLPVNLFERKIVIDVSNRPLKYKMPEQSLACKLQRVLSSSSVVKAFNTLSAYGLQNNLLQGSKEVPVCSDDERAKMAVMNLVRNLGFIPVDSGNLSNAAEIEEIPLKFFPEWKLAGKLSLGVFIFAYLIQFLRGQLCPNFNALNDNQPWDWNRFASTSLINFQTSFALSAITLLSMCYLPGVIASFIQLLRGTKYSEFPKWLDNWLKSRKQIGLITESFALMHVIMAILTLIQESLDDDWRSLLYVTLGCFTIGLMTIVAVTSLPSVSQSLTWREFSFVQRYLGWWCLTFSVLHLIFKKWNKLISDNQRCVIIPDGGQIFIVLPLITVLLKMVLLLPCVYSHLQKIRRGYERTSKYQNAA